MPVDEQRILITQAVPGMVLSQPVVLPNKVALCARGTELSAPLIARLMQRGIKRVHVRGHPIPDLAQQGYAEVVRRLRLRFSRVRDRPVMVELERVVERVLVSRL
jgi:hypothetical protein